MNLTDTDPDLRSDKAGVIIPWTGPGHRPTPDRVNETNGLVEALGGDLAFLRPEQVRKPSPSHLLSGGLLERLKRDVDASGVQLVVIDAALSPIQQRNLERDLQVKVIDRTGLILEIFGLRARTREGRLQVELARLLYERSRLVRTWTHLERQRGGSGFLGGPGETQLEADKRMIDRQVSRLKRDLVEVRRTREVQRTGRRRRETPVVALVGYTNAGKSTLFNRLCGADVLARDMPFATLDPTIRNLALPLGADIALVDTVGFITDLPTHLIDSFRATLEETLEADLILHVRDRSSDSDASQKSDVLAVLEALSAGAGTMLPPILEVWNKIDRLDPARRHQLRLAARQQVEPPAIAVSAETGEGVPDLLALIEDHFGQDQVACSVTLHPADGDLRAWLFAHATIDAETFDEAGRGLVAARLSQKLLGRFRDQFPAAKIVVKTPV